MIPLVRPIFPHKDKIWKYFKLSLDSGLLTNFGPCYELLRARVRQLYDVDPVFTTNGTTAIQIAIQSHYKPGSRILIPDYTHAGTIQAVLAAQCEPILMPVNKVDWLMDFQAFKMHIKNTDGAIIVSPFGYPINFGNYDSVAEENEKSIIYDLAGGFGLHPRTHSTVCYSLHATKNFSCGEGGMVFFRQPKRGEIAQKLINFGTHTDRTVRIKHAGNHKMDDLKCAVVLAHLEDIQKIEERIDRKRELLVKYHQAFSHLIPYPVFGNRGAPSLCVLPGFPAALMEKKSKKFEITIRRYYLPLSEMPAFSNVARVGVASQFFKTCLALPSDLLPGEFEKVVEAIEGLYKKA